MLSIYSAKTSQKPVYDQEKADIFSLGLTALEMTTLQDISFHPSTFTYDFNEIQKLIDSVEGRYSEELHKILEFMLIVNPAQRPTTNQLL